MAMTILVGVGLEPCPFCNGAAVIDVSETKDGPTWETYCFVCKGSGLDSYVSDEDRKTFCVRVVTMSLCEAINKGREQNRAIRQRSWPAGIYAYHGVDNAIRFNDTRQPISMAVATLVADDWELTDAPYHGHHT